MNGHQHMILGVTVVTLTTVVEEYQKTSTVSEETFLAFLVASTSSSLPDLLEPATNPNHRRFFHSLAFALGLGFGVYKAYQWQPQNEWARWGRRILIAAGIAYLVHLLADSTTPMGLPTI